MGKCVRKYDMAAGGESRSSDAISYALTNDFSVPAAHPIHVTFDPIHVDAVG